MSDDITTQIGDIRQAIEALEAQQRTLGLDHTASLAALRQRLEDCVCIVQRGTGAVASTGGVAAGERGVAVSGDAVGNVIVTGEGARISIGEQPIRMTAVQRESAQGRYLSHVISRNRYLQLQGIR